MDSKFKVKGVKKNKPNTEAGHLTLRPLARSQYEEIGVPFDYDLSDYNYNKVCKLADPSTVTKRVTMCQRRKVANYKTKKLEEFLTWHEMWYAEGIGSTEFQKGVDEQVQFKPNYDSEGNVSYQVKTRNTIFTEPFSKEKVEEILNQEGYEPADGVQFTFILGQNTRGDHVVSEDEFKNCSYEEISERAKLGVTNQYPSDVKFLEMPIDKRTAIHMSNRAK